MAPRVKSFLAAFVSLLTLVSCKQDTADLAGRLDNLEERVFRLETLCTEMNGNISSLKSLLTAMQSGDYITSVIPVTSEGKTVGYTISFGKGQPITIYHGKDGAEGHTPVIGVKQDSDGLWYWTMDGGWLLDSNGMKIKAVGTDGKEGQNGRDGLTPQLKIEDGYWFVSTDGGQSWTRLGKATGEDGTDGDSMFSSIDFTSSPDYVEFVLSGGQSFRVPKLQALSIEFDTADLVTITPHSTMDIHYTVTSDIDDITVEAFGSGGMEANVVPASAKTGSLKVQAGDSLNEFSKVVVLVSNGVQAIMRTLWFESDIRVEEGTTKPVGSAGGTVELEFFSNMECQVEIPESAKEWIVEVPSTKAQTKRNLALLVSANTGAARSAVVQIVSKENASRVGLSYTILQEAFTAPTDDTKPLDNQIWYTTTGDKAVNLGATMTGLVSHVYENGKGVITLADAIVEVPADLFKQGTSAVNKLSSVVLPSSVKAIGDRAFQDCNALGSVTLNQGINTIGIRAFSGCTSLESLILPESVSSIGDYAFNSSGIKEIVFPKDVTEIGVGLFADNRALVKADLSQLNLTDLPDYTFTGCTSLSDVSFPSTLKKIGKMAFSECQSLGKAMLPEGLEEIRDMAFFRCYAMTEANVPASVTNYGWRVFDDAGKNAENNVITFHCNLPKQNPWKESLQSTYFENLQFDKVVIAEGVSSIEEYGLAGSGMKEITLPSTLRTIGDMAFYGCKMESVTIPEGVTTLGTSAFYYCSSLKSVSIPSTITAIGDNCFYNTSLESIQLSEGLKTIGASAFAGPVKELTIPSTVISIGDSAIPVDNLETLYMLPLTPPSTPEFFTGTPHLEKLRIVVPVQSYKAYVNAWSGIYGLGRYSYRDNIFPDGDLPEGYGESGQAGEDMEEKDDTTYNL